MDALAEMARRLAENPWLSLTGFLVGVVGLVSGFVIYYISKRTKEPRYAIRSTNLVQDLTGRFRSLEITHRGERIPNLTATTLALWNDGRETIRAADIAEDDPLRIEVKNGHKILEYAKLYEENSANSISTDLSDDQRKLLIKFKYLDRGQGGVIRVLHTGKSGDDIDLCGQIIGVGPIGGRRSPSTWVIAFGIAIVLVMLVSFAAQGYYDWTEGPRQFITPVMRRHPVPYLTALISFIGVLFLGYLAGRGGRNRSSPPKGFKTFAEDL